MEEKRREEIAKQKSYLRNKEDNRKRIEQETLAEMKAEYAKKKGHIMKSVTKSPSTKQTVKDPFSSKGGAVNQSVNLNRSPSKIDS